MQRHKSCNKSKKADVNRAVREREGGEEGRGINNIFMCQDSVSYRREGQNY